MTWQQNMPDSYATVVYYCLMIHNSRAQEVSQEFLSVLLSACATFSCELWISGQPRQDGMLETTLVTNLQETLVLDCASTVRETCNCPDFTVAVATVKRLEPGHIRNVLKQRYILRAYHGH